MNMTLILDIDFDPQEAAGIVGSDTPNGKASKKDVAQYIANSIGSGAIGTVDVFHTRRINGKFIPVGEPM